MLDFCADLLSGLREDVAKHVEAQNAKIDKILEDSANQRLIMDKLVQDLAKQRLTMDKLVQDFAYQRLLVDKLVQDFANQRLSMDNLAQDSANQYRMIVALSRDVNEFLHFQRESLQGSVKDSAAFHLVQEDGTRILSADSYPMHFSIRGNVTTPELFMSIPDKNERKAVQQNWEKACCTSICNWQGANTLLKNFEIDAVVPSMQATILSGDAYVTFAARMAADVKQSASLENMAKGIAQAIIPAAIFLWASQGILLERETLPWICVVLFGEKIQERKLATIFKEQNKMEEAHQLSAAADQTRDLISAGKMLKIPGPQEVAEEHLQLFESLLWDALLDVAPEATVGNIKIPEPLLNSQLDDLFLPYKAVQRFPNNLVKSEEKLKRARAAVSLLASLKIARALKHVYLHFQFVSSAQPKSQMWGRTPWHPAGNFGKYNHSPPSFLP
jgi:hypothetical protein